MNQIARGSARAIANVGTRMWDWLFQFIDPIDRAEIPYALVGSVASRDPAQAIYYIGIVIVASISQSSFQKALFAEKLDQACLTAKKESTVLLYPGMYPCLGAIELRLGFIKCGLRL